MPVHLTTTNFDTHIDAVDLSYGGSATPGLSATNVEDAIDELHSLIAGNTYSLNDYLKLSGGSMTGVLDLSVGSVGTPSLIFDGDTDTGFFQDASNSVAVTSGGNLVGSFGTSAVLSTEGFLSGDTSGAHSVYSNVGTAVVDSSGNTKILIIDFVGTPVIQMKDASGDGIQLTGSGTSGLTVNAQGAGVAEVSAQQIHATQGLTGPSDPILTIGTTDTGFAAGLTDTVTFSQSGTEVFRWDSSGNVLPGSDSTHALGASSLRWLALHADQVLGVAASAAAPTYSWGGASDTGIYYSVGDIEISHAGVNTWSIASNGITAYSASDITLGGGTIREQTVDVNDEVGYEYTLVLADAGQYVRLDDGAATPNDVICHVPTNANVAFPVGTVVTVRQVAGQVEVRGQGGVTVNTPETLRLRVAGSTAQLVKVATNEWDLMGDLEAA